MYELIQAAENSYYIQSPAKIGLIKVSDNEVCLIDSGNDKDAGKKVLKVLNANGWTLKATGNYPPSIALMPMPIISVATSTCKSRPAAPSTHRASRRTSPIIPFWNQPSCMAAIP